MSRSLKEGWRGDYSQPSGIGLGVPPNPGRFDLRTLASACGETVGFEPGRPPYFLSTSFPWVAPVDHLVWHGRTLHSPPMSLSNRVACIWDVDLFLLPSALLSWRPALHMDMDLSSCLHPPCC